MPHSFTPGTLVLVHNLDHTMSYDLNPALYDHLHQVGVIAIEVQADNRRADPSLQWITLDRAEYCPYRILNTTQYLVCFDYNGDRRDWHWFEERDLVEVIR